MHLEEKGRGIAVTAEDRGQLLLLWKNDEKAHLNIRFGF